MNDISLPQLSVVAEFDAPEPAPQSLVFDGERLWVGSWETKTIVAVDRTGRKGTHFAAPGRPVGGTFVNGRSWYVLSDEHDDRTVRSVDGHGHWGEDAFECPHDAGSFLSWDGTDLWLSQRYNKRVLRLDPTSHDAAQVVPIGEQILGQTWIGDWLYLSLWLGKERGGARLARVLGSDPSDLQILASSPSAMVSLAYDGDALWSNDPRRGRVVAFSLPEVSV